MSPASWAETRQISVRIPVRRVLRPSRAGRGLPFTCRRGSLRAGDRSIKL